MGGPDMAPHTPPAFGSAPAEPWRSSMTLTAHCGSGALLDDPNRSVRLGALLGQLTLHAGPGPEHDLRAVVAPERPGHEREARAARAALRARAGLESVGEPRDLGGHGSMIPTQPTRGSSASRRRSPTRLIASTVARMANPGSVGSHHATVTKSRPSEIIWPHVGYERPEPTPRNDSAASARIACATCSVDNTTIDDSVLGRTCRKMMRSRPTPIARAASTNSFSRSAITSARTTRV